jgi:hypothetical protein
MENQVVLQLWEQSERNWGVRPDGCTLHSNVIECRNYINKIYETRQDNTDIPDEYERICGEPLYVQVDSDLFEMIQNEKSVVIPQYALANLLRLDAIVYSESNTSID